MLEWESIHKLPHNMVGCNIKMSYPRLAHSHLGSLKKNWMDQVFWRRYTMPVSLEESSSTQSKDHSDDEENASEIAQPLSSDEVSSHAHYCFFHCES